MTQPNRDEEFEKLLRRLEEGEPERRTPAPPHGVPGGQEAIPTPRPSYRLTIPLARPRAAWALLVINILVFALPSILGVYELVAEWGAKNNRAILGGEYYRLVSSMFLHGSLIHLGFNSFALYSLGLDAERVYGTARFLAVYFLAGLGGSVASYALTPGSSVGASGAIFGLVGALGAFYYQSRGLFGEMSRQQIGSLIFITLINLGIGFSTPRIDNMAHLGGLIVGAAAGLLLAPRLAIDDRLFPPAIVRRSLPYAWGGALALLVALAAAVMLIAPPL